MKTPTDTDIAIWFLEAELAEGSRSEWFFVDKQSLNYFLRDWLRERAQEVMEGEKLKETLRMIDAGALQHASNEIETQLMESHEWGSFRLQRYQPDTITIIKESL